MLASVRRWVYRMDRYWRAGIGMMYQAAGRIGGFGVAGPDGLFEGVEGQVGTKRHRDPPSHDEPRVDVDNKGYVGDT